MTSRQPDNGCIRLAASLVVALGLSAGPAGASDIEALSALLATARQQQQAGQIDQAAESRMKAIGLLGSDEERATQWLELGHLYLDANRPHLEADARAKALEYLPVYDPRHQVTLERLLDLYLNQLGRPRDALSMLESLVAGLEQGRGDQRVWLAIADVRHQMGDTDYARDLYNTLLRPPTRETADRGSKVMVGLEFCERFSQGQVIFNENLEADALVGRFRTRLGEKKWREAAEHLTDLLARFPDAAMDDPDVAAVGPRAVAVELLASMSAAAREGYETACRSEMRRVCERGHSEEIERFGYTHPWPAFEPTVMMSLGDALMAEGRFSRAAACYRKAAAGTSDEDQRLEAQTAAARAGILAREPVPAGLPLDRAITVAGEPMTLGQAIRLWRSETKHTPDKPAAPVTISEMKHDRLALQQAPLVLRKWQSGWQYAVSVRSPRMTDAFIPYMPAGDRNEVFVNTSEMVYAIDPVQERLLWARGPSELFLAEMMPPSLKDLELSNTPKQFYTATSADHVFFRLNWANRTTGQPRSAIHAARRSDGVLLWSSERLPELAQMRYASDPVYADGTVVAAAWEPCEIPVFHLVGFDAVTGELLWKTHLFSGTMFPALRGAALMDSPLGSAPPTIADGVVYFAAGMGVLAAVDLFDGHVRWLQTYPRVFEFGLVPKRRNDADLWAGRFVFNRPKAPIIVRDNLIVTAPQDARGLLFFDADTGQLLRQYESIDFRVLIGADDTHAFVQQGGDVAAVRLSDAELAWKTPLPTSMVVGSPCLSERGIICGTRDGFFVLSPGDGKIIDRGGPASWETVGNPLDLGDRIVAVSHSAVHLLAKTVNQATEWTTPRSPVSSRLSVDVTPPGGLVRWTLPAPDRGHFALSDAAPDLVIVHSWETYELHRTDIAPTMLWEFPAPSWPAMIQFDENVVLLEYHGGRLIAVDVETGKARWDLTDNTMGGERDEVGALIADGRAIWFNRDRIRVLDARTGKTLSEKHFAGMNVRGICPLDIGLGVFLNDGKKPMAVLLDPVTGKEIRTIPLIKRQDDQPAHRIVCATGDHPNARIALPIVLIDGRQLAKVDFARGTIQYDRTPVEAEGTAVRQVGDVLCVSNVTGLLAARSLPDLKPLSVHPAGQWAIADGIEYFTNGPRIVAQDITTGKPLWQTRTFLWETRYLLVSGKVLLAAQSFEKKDRDHQAKVIAIDRTSGEVIDEVSGLATEWRIIQHQGDSLYASDHGYFYRFTEPPAAAPQIVRLSQPRADVDAIAAVRLARDETIGIVDAPPAGRFSPTIDADLNDWHEAPWIPLDWPDAWRPDHVLLGPDRPRRPTNSRDIGAEIAVSQDERFVYLAARVRDDVHDARAHLPLGRGDSLQLIWKTNAPDRDDTFTLTAGLVDRVPCMEIGALPVARPATARTDNWPDWLQSVLSEQDVPWLRRWQEGAVDVSSVALAVRRDELAGETLYELAIPATMLPANRAQRGALLWDISINDADGHERQGALELGTGLMQLQRPTGFLRWPVYD